MSPPASFDEDLMTDWSVWVLDNGLPPWPASLEVGESVPVCYWAGPHVGAVLHVQWSWSDDHEDDALISEIELFRRLAGGWDVSNGRGGFGWFEPPLRRPGLEPRVARITNEFTAGGDGWAAWAADGLAGESATDIELVDADGCSRRPLDSPVGAFIVCTDDPGPLTVRVLDGDGTPLLSKLFANGVLGAV